MPPGWPAKPSGLRADFRRHDADVRGEPRVDGTHERVWSDFVPELDAGHLPERVDPGVSPSRAHNRDRGPLDLGERRFETPLDRRPFRLPLPAYVSGTLVSDGELQGAHHDTLADC